MNILITLNVWISNKILTMTTLIHDKIFYYFITFVEISFIMNVGVEIQRQYNKKLEISY
jgi:hypothetical protein